MPKLLWMESVLLIFSICIVKICSDLLSALMPDELLQLFLMLLVISKKTFSAQTSLPISLIFFIPYEFYSCLTIPEDGKSLSGFWSSQNYFDFIIFEDWLFLCEMFFLSAQVSRLFYSLNFRFLETIFSSLSCLNGSFLDR